MKTLFPFKTLRVLPIDFDTFRFGKGKHTYRAAISKHRGEKQLQKRKKKRHKDSAINHSTANGRLQLRPS